jgi:hypothetical protein
LECPLGPTACVGGKPSAPDVNATATTGTGGSRRLEAAPAVSADDPTQFTFGCSEGYGGPLCALCQENYYFDSSKNVCKTCVGQGATQLALMIAVPCVMLIIIAACVFIFLSMDAEDMGNSRLRAIFNMDLIMSIVADAEDDAAADAGMDADGDGVGDNDEARGICSSITSMFDLKSIMPKVKIMMTVFQIVSGFPFALNIKFPEKATGIIKAFRYV